MRDVDILMRDGCTKQEAEKYIKESRATVYGSLDDFKTDFGDAYLPLLESNGAETDDELTEKLLAKQIEDMGAVTIDGQTYVIVYEN